MQQRSLSDDAQAGGIVLREGGEFAVAAPVGAAELRDRVNLHGEGVGALTEQVLKDIGGEINQVLLRAGGNRLQRVGAVIDLASGHVAAGDSDAVQVPGNASGNSIVLLSGNNAAKRWIAFCDITPTNTLVVTLVGASSFATKYPGVVAFGSAASGVSFGQHVNSAADEQRFYRLVTPSPNP
jgi:hypothetical protein